MDGGGGSAAARTVMVVADPSRESAGALQYALSHAVHDDDTLLLLHVENPGAWRNPFGALFKYPVSPGTSRAASGSYASPAAEGGVEAVDFLGGMRNLCAAAKPRLKVVVEKADVAEGKDKAGVILGYSAACEADLLIIGQKRTLSNSILGSRKGLSL